MDDDPGFFAEMKIAVIGLGLMGGSLALALRGKCAALFGIDPDPQVRALAKANWVADYISGDPAELLPEADMIVLAAPVRAILDLVRQLPEWTPGPAVVTDLGSTKAAITAAMFDLPARFDPVGGHPMCGKETSSLASAEAAIYRGAPFALCALERTSARARACAEALARTVGSNPLWLDPQTHDRWVASTSHLPYLLSGALTAAVPLEAAPLTGPGFRGATRLAASSPAMMLDVLVTNRIPILGALANLREQIDLLTGLLEENDETGLRLMLEQAAVRRESILKGYLT